MFEKMISLKVLSGLSGSCRVALSNKKRGRRIYDEARSRIDILVETSYRFNVVKAKNFEENGNSIDTFRQAAQDWENAWHEITCF